MTDSSPPLSRAILASPSNQPPTRHHPHHSPPKPSSSSYTLTIQPPLLLDVATPIRSMVWQYMDDRSAVQYLSTCHSLHRVYHSYPVKRALSVDKFSHAAYMDGRRSWSSLCLVLLMAGNLTSALLLLASLTLWPVALVVALGCSISLCLCNRTLPRIGCCGQDGVSNGRLSGFLRSKLRPIPRVITVTGTIPSHLLPYLKHVVEARVVDDDSLSIGPHNPLPRSLRTLQLYDSPHLTLKPDTLPPRLTALTLGALKRGAQLKPGVLPYSLVKLHLTGEFNTRSAIVAGVLPPTLQRLEVDEWKLPLSDLVMPASLVHLRVHMLNSDTIRPGTLPPQLEVLQLEGFFDQPHPIGADVLPTSLRVLHLMGCYSQPFTYRTLAGMKQLVELQLSHHYRHPLQPHILPSSLRVLRLGTLVEPVMPGALPSQLHRLIVRVDAFMWADIDTLVPTAVRPTSDLRIDFE